jgi:hypothetical protein
VGVVFRMLIAVRAAVSARFVIASAAAVIAFRRSQALLLLVVSAVRVVDAGVLGGQHPLEFLLERCLVRTEALDASLQQLVSMAVRRHGHRKLLVVHRHAHGHAHANVIGCELSLDGRLGVRQLPQKLRRDGDTVDTSLGQGGTGCGAK